MIAQIEAQKTYTPEEYLEFEVNSEERHEYIGGEIIPMTGGTPNHNQITGNFYAALNFALRKQPYRVFVTDQRLWIPAKRIYTYPDVMVINPPLEYVEHYTKTEPHKWIFTEYDNPEDLLSLTSIPFEIELAQLYDKVDFLVESL